MSIVDRLSGLPHPLLTRSQQPREVREGAERPALAVFSRGSKR